MQLVWLVRAAFTAAATWDCTAAVTDRACAPCSRHQASHGNGRRDAMSVIALLASTVIFAPAAHAVAPLPQRILGGQRSAPPQRILGGQRSAMRFEADYEDAMHPSCERHIKVERTAGPKGYVAHFSGTDVGPPGIGQVVKVGCTEQEVTQYKLRRWEFDARISSDGNSVDADDGIHVGQWRSLDRDETKPWEGIRWKDGNRWVVVDRSQDSL